MHDTRMIIFYKPTGYITSHNLKEKFPSIFTILPKEYSKYRFIGRLDVNTEGLLLLTNNNSLAHYLSTPKNRIPRKYEVKIFGRTDIVKLQYILKQGIVIDKFKYQPIFTNIIKNTKNNYTMVLTMYEGKNREIRKIMSHLDMKVSKIKRICYGKFNIKILKPGQLINAPKSIINYYLSKIETEKKKALSSSKKEKEKALI